MEAALESVIPVLSPVDPASLRGHESTIVRSGLTDIVCHLVFCGHSNVAISKRTGMGEDTVDRFIRSPYFQHMYARKRETMLAQVDELGRERVQEVYLQAIEKKYRIMMDPTTSRGLADKIATDFIMMAERMLKTGRGTISDGLVAIFEQTMKRRDENGKETTATVRLKGTPEEVAAAARSVQGTDVAGGGSEGAGPVPAEGEGDRGASPAEVAGVPRAPWDNGGNGGQRLLPEPAQASPAGSGSGAPESGLPEGDR